MLGKGRNKARVLGEVRNRAWVLGVGRNRAWVLREEIKDLGCWERGGTEPGC